MLILVIVIFLYFYLLKFRKRSIREILIVLGSGGHTSEMLYMMENMDFDNFNKIILVKSNEDKLSYAKAIQFLKEKCKNFRESKIELINIRRVFYKKSFFLISLVKLFIAICQVFAQFLFRKNPQIAFFNGPGTSIPLLFVLKIKKVV
jgi:beta-1,4-N-acetylglucosaminyltransferase